MNKSKLYHLIVDPQYRIWRHILLMLTLAIISFNQMFIAYQDCDSLLGNKIYIICMASLFTYVIATYVNYIFLIPKFLLTDKYIKYIIYLVFFIFLVIFISIFLEYLMRTWFSLPHRINSYTNPLIILIGLSSSMITIICFWSFSVIALFRKWSKKNENIIKLEYEYLQSEINKLKGQVSPHFLSQALQKSSALIESHPDKSSDILMQLGQILRYQLYDCNREKVLLHSEINFITNFLKLKKLEDDNFVYTIYTSGDVNNILISPLLLIVLIQTIVETDKVSHLDVMIGTVENKILLNANFKESYILADKHISEMKDRLDTLYPNLYRLNIGSGKVQLQLNIK